eukprot:scaffold13338_cov284-Alexandrium_tamarense.AAC.8
MISAARLASTRIARATVTPRAVTAVGSTRSFAIGDSLSSKVSDSSLCIPTPTSAGRIHWISFDVRLQNCLEKVEEDRYIRAREQQIIESRRRVAEAEAHAAELASADKAAIAAKNATMHEIADLLATTGDVVSEAGLANLAALKHD